MPCWSPRSLPSLLMALAFLTISVTTVFHVQAFVIHRDRRSCRFGRCNDPSLAPSCRPLHLRFGSLSSNLKLQTHALQAVTSQSPTAATELWLDLRGTKLSPTEAKDRLERDLGCTDFVDRIFIDATLSYTTDISKTATTSMIVQQSYDQTNGRPILVGLDVIIVTLPASGILVDPMPALNAILDTTATTTMYNNNTNTATTLLTKWIVLESEPGEPLPRQEGIASLVPLLAGAAASVGGGGDALLMGEDATTSTSTTRRGCGVAWSCQTRSDLLHAGMVVQSLERVESTRGGILLSSPLSFLTAAGSDDGKGSTQLQCALLLPFDQVLWQTALKFFRESTDPDEGVAGDEYEYYDDDIEDMLSISRDKT